MGPNISKCIRKPLCCQRYDKISGGPLHLAIIFGPWGVFQVAFLAYLIVLKSGNWSTRNNGQDEKMN